MEYLKIKKSKTNHFRIVIPYLPSLMTSSTVSNIMSANKDVLLFLELSFFSIESECFDIFNVAPHIGTFQVPTI